MLDTLLQTLRPHRRPAPSPTPSACGDEMLRTTAAQLHLRRVSALRDWLGEDHDLVRTLPPAAGATDRAASH